MLKTDMLIIGSGIAGLSMAIKTARKLPGASITIITKAEKSETNTRYAQGGIAVVTDTVHDSFEAHIRDTLEAGDGLCDRKIAGMVVKEGPARLEEISLWGMHFDTGTDGKPDLGREGGHSANRIIHHKDITGKEMQRKLLREAGRYPNIKTQTHLFATDLVINKKHKLFGNADETAGDGRLCYGVYAINKITGRQIVIRSKITVLATGGAGQVYPVTTNPRIATGDGIAMAYRAGAEIANMEFIQFHPTAFYHPGENPAFLISEAVRGKGARLISRNGESFTEKFDERGSLAPRDIVARAISAEMERTGEDHVFLDCRALPKEKFKKQFPNIYKKCLEAGIELPRRMIPVAPAAHYLCGGIKTDERGRTSVKNLYACGECACTGLHGANRLASNSLLEALVFAHRCSLDAVQNLETGEWIEFKKTTEGPGRTEIPRPAVIRKQKDTIRMLMGKYAGIVRTNAGLKLAFQGCEAIYRQAETWCRECAPSIRLTELRNLALVACLISDAALKRKVNKGLHYNKDLVRRRKTGRIKAGSALK